MTRSTAKGRLSSALLQLQPLVAVTEVRSRLNEFHRAERKAGMIDRVVVEGTEGRIERPHRFKRSLDLFGLERVRPFHARGVDLDHPRADHQCKKRSAAGSLLDRLAD